MDAHLLLLRQTNLKPPQIVFGSFMFMSPASRLTSELQAKPFLTKKKKETRDFDDWLLAILPRGRNSDILRGINDCRLISKAG
jgi:hypothetical protein